MMPVPESGVELSSKRSTTRASQADLSFVLSRETEPSAPLDVTTAAG